MSVFILLLSDFCSYFFTMSPPVETLELRELVRKRGNIKASLTRMQSFAEKFDSNTKDVLELEFRQERIPEIWKKFDDIQSQIEMLDFDNEIVQAEERAVFESNYFATRSLLQSLIKSSASPENVVHNSTMGGHSVQPVFDRLVRLPPMSLPTFDGDIQKWTPFFDAFCSLVHFDAGLTDIQKLYYLRSCLTGSATDVIQSISSTSDNYMVAFERLRVRYENKTLIVQSHIRALLNLPKVNEASAAQLRHLHHTVTSHVESLHALGEAVDYWDAWLVTILLGRLDKATASEWILRQSTSDLPTYVQMELFISSRCIAYEANEITNPPVKEKNINYTNDIKKRENRSNRSFITLKQNSNLTCPACSGNHRTYMCDTFKALKVSERYDVIRKIKGCFNCLSAQHMSDVCKSLVLCRTCGKKHHSLLHYNVRESSNNLSSESQKQPNDANIHAVQDATIKQSTSTIPALYSRLSGSQILLATALLNVQDSFGQQRICRALLDSGSQVNCMTERLVQLLQLPFTGNSLSIK